MSGHIKIKNQNHWASRGNIRLSDFLNAASNLGFRITQPNGGSSHYAIRKADILTNGLESLVTNVYEGMSKQVKGIIIKRLIECGIDEDELWKQLGK